MQNIVAYRPIAKRRLYKQRPLLRNGSVKKFPLLGSRFSVIQQLDTTIKQLCFLCDPCRNVISKGQGQLIVLYARGLEP
jgi:hypothetical protein